MRYKNVEKETMQIVVKSVTENVVICNLVTVKGPVEILMKRVDYDRLVEQEFFTNEKHNGVTTSATGVYEIPNPFIVENV